MVLSFFLLNLCLPENEIRKIIEKKETVRSLCEKAGNTARLRVIKGSAEREHYSSTRLAGTLFSMAVMETSHYFLNVDFLGN